MSKRLLRLALLPVLLATLLMGGRALADDYPDLAPSQTPAADVQGVDMDALRECINGIGGDVPGNELRCSAVVTDAAAATNSGVNGDNLRECLNVLWRGAPGNLLSCTLVVTNPAARLGAPINDVADNLQECLNRMSGIKPGYPRWGSHMSLCPNRIPPALIPFPDLTPTKIEATAEQCPSVSPHTESTALTLCNDITITNQGDGVAGPFVVSDTLGTRISNTAVLFQLTVISAPPGTVCFATVDGGGNLTGFQCNFPNLGIGESALIWFDFTFNATCTDTERQAGSYTANNTVIADATNAVLESNELNNAAAVTYQVNCLLPDLTVDKTGPSQNDTGSYTYNITVNNVGAGPANGVVFRDNLPGNTVTATSATPSQGSCNLLNGGRTVECNLGTIAAGGNATIAIDVTWSGGDCNTTVINTGTADPDNVLAETNEGNNDGSATTYLICIG